MIRTGRNPSSGRAALTRTREQISFLSLRVHASSSSSSCHHPKRIRVLLFDFLARERCRVIRSGSQWPRSAFNRTVCTSFLPFVYYTRTDRTPKRTILSRCSANDHNAREYNVRRIYYYRTRQRGHRWRAPINTVALNNPLNTHLRSGFGGLFTVAV